MNKLYKFAISLLFSACIYPQTAHADDTDVSLHSSTVVYVKTDQDNQNLIWQKVEKRIQEELELLNLRAIVGIGSATDKPGIEQELRDVAASNEATAAFRVVKESENEFIVSLFTPKRSDRPESFKALLIHLPSNTVKNETIEIVSLKTVEAVQAAVLVDQESMNGASVDPLPPRQLQIKVSQTSITSSSQIRLKPWAITSLVSGIVILGVGGVLHSQKLVHEVEANRIAKLIKANRKEKKYEEDNGDQDKRDIKNNKEEAKNSTNYRKATIITYAVGATLTAVGAVLGITTIRKKRGQEQLRYTVKSTATGLIVEF